MRVSLLVAVSLVVACGGKDLPPKPIQVTVDAGPPAPVQTVSKLPDAKLPPPLDFGSPLVERKAHTDWAACSKSITRNASAATTLADVTKACGAASGLHAGPAPSLGKSSASADPTAVPVHVDKGKCVRVFATAAPSVKALVVIVKDASGRPAAIYKADDLDAAIAPPEALCFKETQDATLSISVGSGDGDYAVQLWTD
jgi:hypothetical protein